MLEIIERIPMKDTTINSAMAYENYGDYYALFIGKYMNHSIYRSLLQFDLPTLSGHGLVEKVELLLYVIRNDETTDAKEFEVYRVTEIFDENRVNYANTPAFDKELYKIFTINDEINTYIKVDITKLFSDWYSGKYPNYGLIIKAVDENKNNLVGFYSKDAQEAAFIPKLQINFNQYMRINKKKDVQNIGKDKLAPEKYYSLGNDSYEAGDYDEAYDCYKKSLEECTSNEIYVPKLFFKMIMVCEKLGKYDEALKTIEQGLKYYPNFTDLVFLRANLLYLQGKTFLAIKSLHQCINMGESPPHINFLAGVESYRTFHTLSQIYYDLEDFDEAYHYSMMALHKNPKYAAPLHMIVKILIDKQRDIYDIKSKAEDFLGTDLDGKDYMILGNVFFEQRKYTIAYEYFSKAEEFINNNLKISYHKGMCQLYLKEYDKAYNCFVKIKEGALYEEAVYMEALCKILSLNMRNAVQLLNILRNPENNHRRMIYYGLKDILEGKMMMPISDKRKESEGFLNIIFDLLDILIKAADPEIFEKSLQLLNLIEHDEVLLKLAKLYYKHRFYKMAYQEFTRSIKLFDKIDLEGLGMMKKALEKMNNASVEVF
ncbi:tetratricopeptide (TPR) repeat protein [Anaerosolibacter carboniphilus]|uniref:Tetratricopeptide (TPR) repeat protein n=1 Tax=Anaerosolibacter carboniphilus TaxID=1417629 RepID=A0A841KQU5_9FIRM|nr:DNRLRE domain-containing protein [Anaerosolibacter carboniphilus]MBB6215721.1 tetratricopeptide (TPR) repeat protein [Anaerosolibacter carboniphilus]